MSEEKTIPPFDPDKPEEGWFRTFAAHHPAFVAGMKRAAAKENLPATTPSDPQADAQLPLELG